MRILLANESRRGGGGVETYLASLVGPLLHRGHGVALLYANPSAEPGPTTIVTLDSWSVADDGLDAALARARNWKPDVCFSHNMRPLGVDERLTAEWPTVKMMHGYFGACVSGQKAFAYPSLVACTRRCGAGCLAYYLPRRCGQRRPDLMLAQYVWAMRQQRLFPRYAGIVVASDHMRREYLRYELPADRVHAIPLLVADDGPTPTPAGPPIDVLFVGRMTTLKGPEVLLSAARYAGTLLGRRLHVVMAGEGPARARVEALARGDEMQKFVALECPGWVDPPGRSALFARASVVAVPSLWPEPFGLVGLEAARHGVPAIAFDVGGVRQWLEDEVNGLLVEPGVGSIGFGDAIIRMVRCPEMRTRLSAGARAAAARLSVDAHVAALEDVLSAARHDNPC